ncbi:MAG: hypothetical protein RMY64_29530 [Nostoc sp. DedQUE08]|uniref:hypothetical protein n=1 Tax=Nostoc sp. DedQUE08 TaxID=3075393 RepID=UPI002AD3EA69|nr:hypothetical protein [Nostoc sp. DedQUE08]MDZ8069702.1 hypothetical protein [Nostoc sp. DedQUE08]
MNKDKLLNDTTSIKSQNIPKKLANASPNSDAGTQPSPKSDNSPEDKSKNDEGKGGKIKGERKPHI